VERLVAVVCPGLTEEGERGEERRRFLEVLAAVEAFCPWVTPVRPGVCTLPARGPSRFFGGEVALVDRLARALAPVVDEEEEEGRPAVRLGVADGLFAALLASRVSALVPAGGTAAFLAPWPVDTLGRPDLSATLPRLGVTTLGEFAALAPVRVSARFGGDAAVCHRVARGEEGELEGLRDPATVRRLTREVTRAAGPAQEGFFGGATAADERAAAALARVRDRLGPEEVLVARLAGGRGPADRGRLVPWGSPEAAAGPVGAAPWPGRLPPPSPAKVLTRPTPVELVGPADAPVRVSGRGLLEVAPGRLSVGGGPWEPVAGWAGPWPETDRWWSSRRRRARLQVVTADAVAHLLVAERGGWWVEATYD
jgi:hypothetical protein